MECKTSKLGMIRGEQEVPLSSTGSFVLLHYACKASERIYLLLTQISMIVLADGTLFSRVFIILELHRTSPTSTSILAHWPAKTVELITFLRPFNGNLFSKRSMVLKPSSILWDRTSKSLPCWVDYMSRFHLGLSRVIGDDGYSDIFCFWHHLYLIEGFWQNF